MTSSWDGEARTWNIETGELHVRPLRGHVRGVNQTQFTSDDRTLVTSGDDGTTRIWNVATSQEMIIIQDAPKAMLEENGNTIITYCCAQRNGVRSIPIPTLTEIDRMETLRNSFPVDD
ncbi:hypothetical protein OAM01_00940 [bacterium]|nr:hypothetical protein [bacterium]